MKEEIIFICICMIIFIVISAFGFLIGYREGYQSGQVNAIRGNIKYELVEQRNDSTKWKKIKRKEFPE